jgi:hypothetical protein
MRLSVSANARRIVTALVLMQILVLSGCSGAAQGGQQNTRTFTSTSSGGLVARSGVVDLGRVPFDVQAEGRFELVNTGAQPVKVLGPPQVKMLEGC